MLTRDGRPGLWPERPARCSSRATPLGDPICSTRSTGAKSTPRSRLLVHTTACKVPSCRPASTHSRTARSSEPWCSAICPAQSGRASSSAWYHSSACARVLVNTRVLPLASISATTVGSMARPRCPAHGKRSTVGGNSVSTVSVLGVAPRTNRPCGAAAGPSRVCIASSRLPSVADMPQTCSAGFQRRSRAMASCACTPRLLPISSCHSSTTTSAVRPSCSCASARAISRLRLSGVVTSAVGRRLACCVRSLLLVSPLRAPAVHAGASSGSGACSARSVSAASARMGVSQITVSGGVRLASASASACSAPSHTA